MKNLIIGVGGTNMKIKDFKFETPTVCICEPNRYERLYDGPIEKIPSFLVEYRIVYYIINKAINNTYMEAVVR